MWAWAASSPRRTALLVGGAVLALVLLLLFLWRARRRWREGKSQFDQLRRDARSMNLQQQPHHAAGETVEGRKPPPTSGR